MEDFAALEARLWTILEPYRDRLEANDLYGVATLMRPGGRAHDFFAGVRVGPRHVAFHLMPVYAHPSLLDGISPGLRRHMKGKTTFDFTTVDEALLTELEELTARCFEAYRADGAGTG